MRQTKAYWVARMNLVSKTWAALRPDMAPAGRRVTAGGFHAYFKRAVAPGLRWEVSLFTMSGIFVDKEWGLIAHISMYDRDLSDRVCQTFGRDVTRTPFNAFAVQSANELLRGKAISSGMPEFFFKTPDTAVDRQLSAYSRQVDRIWRFAGGQDREAFRKLAIWSMKNAEAVGTSLTDPYMICAAWAYGEPALAKLRLAEYEARWKRKIRDQPAYRSLPNFWPNLLDELDRLREMMGMPPKDPVTLGMHDLARS
jgi:hypothetical protein